MMSVDASGFGTPSPAAFTPPSATPPPAAAPAPANDRPEILVGAAFVGGLAFALLLKRAGRVS